MQSLKQRYQTELRPALKEELGLANINEVPKILKVTLNMGVGEAVTNKKVLESALQELSTVAGQKAMPRMARKSVASFKVREGWPVGAKVTLRGNQMYDFIFRLVHIALPRVRDFRGLSPRSFDGKGNYNIGIKELIIFPEIDFDKVDKIRGLDIAITTSANTDEHALSLLKSLQFPFAN